MNVALKLVHDKFVEASSDGSVLLDPALDLFKPIKDTQPLFAEWHDRMFDTDHVMSPDGTEPHLVFKLARDELLNPTDPTNGPTLAHTAQDHVRVP
jgi:hypothetical protein